MKYDKWLPVIVCCWCLAAVSAGAAQTQTDFPIGKAAGPELKIGLGARPVAMGGAFAAKADDLNSTAWNPAGLAQMQGHQLGFMHDIYLMDTSLEYLAYAQRLFPGSGLGATVSYLNFGQFEKTLDVGGPVLTGENFTPTTMTLSVGYGQWLLPALAVGGSLKFISQNIDTENYSAMALDLGLLLKTGLDSLQLGAVIQNLGTQLAQSSLPQNAKVGAAYTLPVKIETTDTWSVLADVNLPFQDTHYTSVNLGTEYWYKQLLALRVGYVVKDTGDLSGVTGLTAGAGLKLAMWQLDYALASYGDLGLSHQIALMVNF